MARAQCNLGNGFKTQIKSKVDSTTPSKKAMAGSRRFIGQKNKMAYDPNRVDDSTRPAQQQSTPPLPLLLSLPQP